jgi:hypothetical protein
MSDGTAEAVETAVEAIVNHVSVLKRANIGNQGHERGPREQTWPTGGGRDSMRLISGILVHSLPVAAIAISSPIAGFMTIRITLNTHEIDRFRKPVYFMSFGIFVYRDGKIGRLWS